jgi:hypothetical protein
MKHLKFKVILFAVIFVSILFIGTVGFSILEGTTLTDSFYFTIATISTVGYGDVHPLTTTGKILAVFIIIVGVGAFLGIVANSLEIVLSIREKKQRHEKINMLIGVFYSEAGNELITRLSAFDHGLDKIRKHMVINIDSTIRSFDEIRKILLGYHHKLEMSKSDFPPLKKFLTERREFFLRLMENPNLLEHESFSDLLMAVFHMTEELAHRKNIAKLPESDLKHLTGDTARVYTLLIAQWLDYMQHLKKNYPYLFSLAIRINPFNPEASPVVIES